MEQSTDSTHTHPEIMGYNLFLRVVSAFRIPSQGLSG